MTPPQERNEIEAARCIREAAGTVRQANNADEYVLTAPLCRGYVKLEGESGLIYEGAVRPGMLKVLAPGEHYTIDTPSRSDSMVVTISGARFRELCSYKVPRHDSDRRLPLYRSITTPNFQIERLCNLFLAVTELSDGYRRLFVEGLAGSLVAVLLNAQMVDTRGSDKAPTGLSDAELLRATDYVRSLRPGRLDLGAWATAVGLPTNEFAKRFTQRTGTAPYAWFMSWRIDKAKQLLLEPNLTLVEVAFDVGFCSQSHFTEAFRRRTGLSPGRWRTRGVRVGS